MELAGQRAPDERGGVDPFGGRIELGFDGVLRRRRARVGRPFVESGRQPMCERAVVAEASEHVGGRQRGEIAERAQTEPAQHVDEIGTVERVERAAVTGTPRSLPEGRRAVVHSKRARPRTDRRRCRRWTGTRSLQHIERERTSAVRQRLVASEVASRTPGGEGALPGDGDLDARCQFVERGDHGFEGARITGRIVIEDDELGATALRLPPAQPDIDTRIASRGRRGNHTVGEEHGCRFVERHTRRHHRPVRTRHDQRPNRWCRHADRSERNGRTSASSSTAATPPPAAGNHSGTRRVRAAARRPPASTTTWRACRCPCPSPMPCHSSLASDSPTSGASGHVAVSPSTTSTEPRSRARAVNRRASATPTLRRGRTSTTSKASTNVATTVPHDGDGGSATTTRCSRSTPSSAAAARPSEDTPTAASHEPSRLGPADQGERERGRPLDARPCSPVATRRGTASAAARARAGSAHERAPPVSLVPPPRGGGPGTRQSPRSASCQYRTPVRAGQAARRRPTTGTGPSSRWPPRAVRAEGERRSAQRDAELVRLRPHRGERLVHPAPQPFGDGLFLPGVALLALRPLEVRRRHPTGVGEDVGDDDDAPLVQDRLGFPRRRAVRRLDHDACRELLCHALGDARRPRRGGHEQLARQRVDGVGRDRRRRRRTRPPSAVADTCSDSAATSSPPSLTTAPPMSLTAMTRMPADDSRNASGPPTLPNPSMTARLPASSMSSISNARRTHTTTPDAVAPECMRVPPIDSGLPVTAPGMKLSGGHRQRVHHPRHHAAVGVDVGRRDVTVRAEQRRDLVRVAARQPLELAEAQPRRVAPHAALRAAERQVGDGGLERHRRRECLHLVDVEVRVESQAALAGATRRVVLHAPAGEHLDRTVVHPHRHRDLEHPDGDAELVVDRRVDPDQLRRVIQTLEDRGPRRLHTINVARPGAVAVTDRRKRPPGQAARPARGSRGTGPG